MSVSLRASVSATWISQLYVALVGIFVTPLYLRALGAEAYGLVGFFAMLLAWFQLLDTGLSPAVMRETARYRGQALDALGLRRTVRAAELIFAALAVVAAVTTALLADPIAAHWFKLETLSAATAREALWVMAATIGLRFASILYRAVLSGMEELRWVAGFNVAIATLRAFAVLPAMSLWGGTPIVFFTAQLFISLLELVMLVRRAMRSLPAVAEPVGCSLQPLRNVARFSAAVAFTGAMGVALTQADRLILSGLLTLEAYAHYNLAVLVAGAVLLAGSPLGAAMQPRLATLAAAGQRAELLRLYTTGTRVVSAVTLPAALVLAVHPQTVLWAWTGQAQVAEGAAPVLALYALGNAVMAHLALPYALQFALGHLRLHVIGNALLVLALIPGQTLLTLRWGAVGAGSFWLGCTLVYGCVWIPFAMRQLAPDALAGWHRGIAQSALACAAVVVLLWPLHSIAVEAGRAAAAAYLVLLGLGCTAAVVVTSPPLRAIMKGRMRRSPAAEAA